MTEHSPTTKPQSAGQDLLARTNEVAERVAAELKSRAEPTAEQVTSAVNELIAWARHNGERLLAELDDFRSVVEARLAPVSIVTKADLAALEARVADAEQKLAQVTETSPARKTATKKTATRKTPTEKTPAPAAPEVPEA